MSKIRSAQLRAIGMRPWREPVAKVLLLQLCRKLCRSLSRKTPDPTKVATKAADKVFSCADFFLQQPLAGANTPYSASRLCIRLPTSLFEIRLAEWRGNSPFFITQLISAEK